MKNINESLYRTPRYLHKNNNHFVIDTKTKEVISSHKNLQDAEDGVHAAFMNDPTRKYRIKHGSSNESIDESRMAELHDSIDRHVEPHIRAYKAGKIDADTLGHRIVLAHDKVAKDTGHPVELVRRLVNDHADDRLSESTELEEMAGPAVLGAARLHAKSEFAKGKSRSDVANSWKRHPANKNKGNIRFNDDDTVHSVTESIDETGKGAWHHVQFEYDKYDQNSGKMNTASGSIKLEALSKKHALQTATNDLAHKYTGFRAIKATEMKSQNEAALGTIHRVLLSHDSINGDGSRSTRTVSLFAPSKEHAKRYAIADAEHLGFKNVKATRATERKQYEEIEMKPTRKVILEAIARVKEKMINEEIVYEDEVDESLKGSPWDPKAEPLSHYLPSKPKAARTGDAGETITSVKGSYGKDDDDEDEDGNKKPKFEPPVKRGRGRPAGSKSGARTHGEDGGVKNQAIYGGHEHSMLTPSASRFSK